MIVRYNNISLALGVPGIILQVVGRIGGMWPVLVLGTILLIAGLAYYAMAKGRSPAWGLMGFLSILGLAILACLKDETLSPKAYSTAGFAGNAPPRPLSDNPFDSPR